MSCDDRAYFFKRAKEEEAAVIVASNPSARSRHEELASIYRMRTQHLEREARGEPPPAVSLPESEPPIAAAETAETALGVLSLKGLVV